MKRKIVVDLLELARSDYELAALVAATYPRQAGFHFQQAAEKALKAVLVVEDIPYPYIHSLFRLAQLLPESNRWRSEFTSLDPLTDHATVLRYEAAPPDARRVSPLTLAETNKTLSALLPEVERWCLERLAD